MLYKSTVFLLQKLDWTSRSSLVVQMYQSMMLHIVSVHTVYLRACLRALVKKFMPGTSFRDISCCKKHLVLLLLRLSNLIGHDEKFYKIT